MQELLPDGGVIRKLWIGEHNKYRDHLVRLDSASRHSRFGGGVSDDFIRNFVDLSLSLDAVVHGFFVDGVMRGAAELRQPRSAWRSRGRAAASARRCCAEPCWPAQSRLSPTAHGLLGREPAHAAGC